MREKLNENPMVQVALLGVLALIVGFLVITRMGGGSTEETTAAPATSTATDPAAAAAAATPAADGTIPATAATPSTPDTGATAATTDFKAGPGLPKAVVDAYDSGKVVVLLVVNNGSIDDDKVKTIAEGLRTRSDTSLFMVESRDVADYSRIAQGVDLQQTPALVVLRAKKLNEGPQPTATIAYGFRGPDSVEQAVDNALYKGRDDLPYYPE